MSTFKCPSCQAELPDFQQAAGFCPYCDAKWEDASAEDSTSENSTTLNIDKEGIGDHPHEDTESAPEPSGGQTIQLERENDGPSTGINQTIDLPGAADVGQEFMGSDQEEGGQTIQLSGEDTSATIVPDKVPSGEDPNQTVNLEQDDASDIHSNQTIDLPAGGSVDSMQTIDLPEGGSADSMQTLDLDASKGDVNRTAQTMAFQLNDDNQQTIDIGDSQHGQEDLHVTFGSKPLSPSDVKRFWGSGEGSPMQTMRTATVCKAKELGVDLRRRVLSDQEEGSDYAIINQIGKGGMGVVYAAKQKSLRRRVAVKTLKRDIGQRDDDRAKFLSEAVITGVLDHPNIVPIHELGQTEDGTLFYSMKCVTGTEWHKVVRNKTEAENLEIFLKVADAVAFAHSKNVIHRDLKPENVMLGEYGEVLVMDWGLAVDLNRKEEFTMGGTPAYMSPEMAKGPLERIGKCSDIYLLGAMLYEIVTGFPPHAASTITECLVAAAQNVIVRSDSTSRLKNIALKAMATSPKLRFNSVALLQEEVRKYQATAQSIELTNTAQRELETAKETDNYELFSRAMFGFEDALKLWGENDAADRGIHEARQEYAKCALKKADYDLGLQLVSPTDPDEAPIYQDLITAKADAERTARNAKVARYVAVGSLMFALVGAGVGLFIINGLYQKAEEAAQIAIAAEKEATEQRDEAQKARDKAEGLAKALETERDTLKVTNKKLDDALADITNANEELAMNAKTIEGQNAKLQKQTKDLQTALVTVEQERNRATFAGMFASVGLAQSKVEANDISAALNLLEDVPVKYRGWEWKHLAYLCHPDVPRIAFKEAATSVAISPDGQWTAIGTDGGGVDVYPTQNAVAPGVMAQHVDVPDSRITALQFSNDGKQLWIGTDHSQKYLQIWDLKGKPAVVPLSGLNPYSTFPIVSAIEFVPDNSGVVFVAVSGRCYRLNANDLKGRAVINVDSVFDLAISPDGKEYVHTQESRGEYNVSRLPTDGTYKEIARMQLEDRATHCVYLTNDLTALALADGSIKLWGGPSKLNEIVYTLPSQANQLHFDRRKNLMSVALADGSVKLLRFDPASNALSDYKTLRGHQGSVLDCAVHLSQPTLVSVSEDNTSRFWNYETYQDRLELDLDDSVLWVNFSENGNQFITGDRGGRAWIWNSNTSSEKPLQEFVVGDWTKQNVAQKSATIPLGDGKHVVTADADVGVAVWDIKSKQIVWKQPTFAKSYQVAAVPKTDRFLFVDIVKDGQGAEKTMIRAANSQGESVFNVHSLVEAKQILDLVVAPSGNYFAMRSPNGIRVYPMPTGSDTKLAAEIWNSDSDPVLQMEFRSDDTILLGYHPGQGTGRVSIVDFKNRKDLHEFPTSENNLRYLHFGLSPDESHVAIAYTNYTGSQSADIKNTVSQISLYALDNPQKPVSTVQCKGVAAYPAVSNDNKVVYFVQQHRPGDRDIARWEVSKPESEILAYSRKGTDATGTSSREVGQVEVIPGSADEVLVAFSNRDIEVWNTSTGKSLARLAPSRAVIYCDFYNNDQQVLTVHVDGLVRIWDTKTGNVVDQYEAQYQTLEAAARIGDLLAVGGSAGEVVVFDLAKKAAVQALPYQGSSIDALAWVSTQQNPALMVATSRMKPDADAGERLAGSLNLIDGGTWQPIGEAFAEHAGRYRSLAASKSGARFAATSSDTGVRLWADIPLAELATTEPRRLEGHSTEVTSAAFSANGERLVTGSFDGSLTVWFVDRPAASADMAGEEAPKGELHVQQFVPLKGHRKEISSIVFSPNSELLLTSSLDRSAILWFTTNLPDNLAGNVAPEKDAVASAEVPAAQR
ncbi:Serine/threonine-protein kinase PknD [Bremerella volcania]|uniref:Serine/threonine-protein kinase PknD n=1 Tax=Bremerella volcania TaxID=2527984 RepID=A0A518C3R0_9BACT|nr:WD40 repeat domain-containing serine/threonine-protein kinase [Bremerella volcania]QDU73824.1 Serine/threonine-protein kinase PknD [Bremerella volcania]